MLGNKILLGIVGFAAGGIISAGVFAFISAIGLVQRLAGKTGTAHRMRWYEDCFVLGGTLGNLAFLYDIPVPGGQIFLGVVGVAYGIFVGCLIMSLAETLNAFPVLCRRLKLSEGMHFLVFSLALGKCLGSFFYFIQGMTGS